MFGWSHCEGLEARPTRLTIYLDNGVLETFRQQAEASGRGYQTLINQALRDYLAESPAPLDEPTLRRVVREELERVGQG